MENRQLTLDLQTENKGSVVSGGELTVFLDGPAVALGSVPVVPDGSAGSEGECEGECECPVRSGSGVSSGVPGQHPPLPPEAPAQPRGLPPVQECSGSSHRLPAASPAAWEEQPFCSPPPAFHTDQPLPSLDQPLPCWLGGLGKWCRCLLIHSRELPVPGHLWGHGLVADLSGVPGEQSLYRTGIGALLSLGSFSFLVEDKTCEIRELWMQCCPGTASSAESCVLPGLLGCVV